MSLVLNERYNAIIIILLVTSVREDGRPQTLNRGHWRHSIQYRSIRQREGKIPTWHNLTHYTCPYLSIKQWGSCIPQGSISTWFSLIVPFLMIITSLTHLSWQGYYTGKIKVILPKLVFAGWVASPGFRAQMTWSYISTPVKDDGPETSSQGRIVLAST